MFKKTKSLFSGDPFADFAEIYELTHGDKDDDLPLYLELARASGSPVLEIGCGTGRVSLALAKNGFSVVGIDLSENMLKIAREKIKQLPKAVQERITLYQQDMCELNIPDQRFLLALMPYGEFAHVLERSRQEKALKAAFEHLVPGGMLIISMSNWDAHEQRISYKGTPIAHWGHSMPLTYEGVFYDEKNQQMITRYIAKGYDPSVQIAVHVYIHEITDKDGHLIARKTNVLPIRYIFRYEMELLLEKAGFVLENIYGYYDKSEFRFDSRRMIVVARKP
ncbi:MAG: class I SAM-dependent methyltransferase [Calditrichaeota bacterium]|nr:MAG: class I SAM-dependent methyltransferase [Calditrichota bacterium]